MSSGARLQTYYGVEATPAGTVAAWKSLRVTGNTLMPKNSTVKSDEITPNRLSGGSVVTAVDVSGDINGELSYGTFDDFMAAAFFNTWQALLAAPVQSAAATSATGGTLAAGTYFYKVTAIGAAGESLGSNEQSIATTGTTSKNTITWATVVGATSYRIYRGTAAGLENKYFTVGAVLTFDDVGGVGTTGIPPVGTTGDILSIGSTPSTLAIAKTYSDVGIYTVFKGCYVSKMTMTIPESGKITTSFTMAGLSFADNTASPYVVTPADPTTTSFTSSINVGDILVDGVSLAGSACVTSLDFTLDNNMKVQRCLGQGLAVGAQISGGADVTGSFTLAWSASSYAIWKKSLTRQTVAITFPITDSAGNSYRIDFDQAEVDGDLPDGARTDVVSVKLTFMAVRTSPTITRTPAP